MSSLKKSRVKQSILTQAVKWLARRSYSENELEEKLKIEGYLSQEIVETIAILKDKNALNDLELGNRLFEKYCNENKYSLKAILLKLKQKGIPNSIINQILQDATYDEYSAAYQCAFQSKNQMKEPKKVILYLSRKGFSKSIIDKVMSNCDR